MFRSKNKNLNSQGVTLVVALLILSLAASTVMLVTGLIALQIKSSLNTVNSIAAYYAGESGVEQGLYYIKYSRENSDFASNFDYLENASFDSVSLDNAGKYNILVASTTLTRFWDIYNLSTSSPQHIDIVDPAGRVESITNGPSGAFSINWSINSCFPTEASSRLETTINSFESNFANPQTRTLVDICNCAYGNDSCESINYVLDSNRYYRIGFRALDANVKNLKFSLDSGIKSQASIEAEGFYRNSRYRVKAQLPALSPTSDIFSYVIFSEEDLTKGY
jgi:hypothetical protein